ncbi:MAG: hypothetical protein NT164_01770 [Verrucomicrobiae bacterium]|nr:hypothetical protein [Verrucomicrobiae bacterium]
MSSFRNTHQHNRKKANNGIEVPLLTQWLILFFVLGLSGLFFVYLKNQQHAIGKQTRIIEEQLVGAHAHNDALIAKITGLTSRGALQHKLDEKCLDLVPIPETAIARITMPASSQEGDGMRTASVSLNFK